MTATAKTFHFKPLTPEQLTSCREAETLAIALQNEFKATWKKGNPKVFYAVKRESNDSDFHVIKQTETSKNVYAIERVG